MVSFVGSHFAKFVSASNGGVGKFDLFAELDDATQGKRGLLDPRTMKRPRALLDEPDQLGWVIHSAQNVCTVKSRKHYKKDNLFEGHTCI